MATIGVLGAGPLGGAAVYALAAAAAGRRLVLVDDAGSIAAGKALDIRQSGPIEPFDVDVTGATDAAALAGADVIIVADQAASGRDWTGDPALSLVARVIAVAPSAIVVFAGHQQAGALEHAAAESVVAPQRVVGSAALASCGAMRALVAIEAGVAAGDVALLVVGRSPDRLEIVWDASRVRGEAATSLLDAAAIRRVESRRAALGPPGPYALASAAARIARAAVENDRRAHLLSVAGRLLGGSGVVTLPACVGRDGVSAVRLPDLPPPVRVALELLPR